jgi:ribosomal protein S18 acetylase RimI-like enzyme
MTDSVREGLVARLRLSPLELDELRELARICDEHDHATVRFNWDTLATRSGYEPSDFLFYRNNKLVGALSIYAFSRDEAEASGMVHPDERRKHIFTTLAGAAVAELRRRGIPRLVFFCDHRSKAGIALLEASSAEFSHSEYRMDLEELRLPEQFDERLVVERADIDDVDAVVEITANAFNMPKLEFRDQVVSKLDSEQTQYYVARLDGKPIGVLTLILGDNDAGIYGFAVIPELRGRGYGRQILIRVIQKVRESSDRLVYLEVAPENDRALGLYTSVGFREVTRYDYYVMNLEQRG